MNGFDAVARIPPQLVGPSMKMSTVSANPLIRLWTTPSGSVRSHRPLLYSIDEALGVIFVDVLAVNDAPAVVQGLQQIRLNPSFRRDLSACVDCRCLTHAPDAADIRAIAKLWRRGVPGDLTGRCAIVASSPWTYGGARTFAKLAHASDDRVRVFNACDDALLWLRGSPQS